MSPPAPGGREAHSGLEKFPWMSTIFPGLRCGKNQNSKSLRPAAKCQPTFTRR